MNRDAVAALHCGVASSVELAPTRCVLYAIHAPRSVRARVMDPPEGPAIKASGTCTDGADSRPRQSETEQCSMSSGSMWRPVRWFRRWGHSRSYWIREAPGQFALKIVRAASHGSRTSGCLLFYGMPPRASGRWFMPGRKRICRY
jgi:hypothetical protein